MTLAMAFKMGDATGNDEIAAVAEQIPALSRERGGYNLGQSAEMKAGYEEGQIDGDSTGPTALYDFYQVPAESSFMRLSCCTIMIV
jgi:hypothetical protein